MGFFADRHQAGRLLGARLNILLFGVNPTETVVLALPRGGVPIGYEIAKALRIHLDVLIVRKIGHPHQPEYGIGAIAEDDFYWFDPEAVEIDELSEEDKVALKETGKREVNEGKLKYRRKRNLPSLENKTVILADDGLATGVTARVAAKYVKARGAKKIILVAPVCAERTAIELRKEIDEVICLHESLTFCSVGQFYNNFDPVTDDEVLSLLALAKERDRSNNS